MLIWYYLFKALLTKSGYFLSAERYNWADPDPQWGEVQKVKSLQRQLGESWGEKEVGCLQTKSQFYMLFIASGFLLYKHHRFYCNCVFTSLPVANIKSPRKSRKLVIPYNGKLSREKTFVNWWNFCKENFCGLLCFAMPKDASLSNFMEKTFANCNKTAKFAKVFSLKSFPLYGITLLLYNTTIIIVTVIMDLPEQENSLTFKCADSKI